MGRQLKQQALIRVRTSYPLKNQILQWATRAGLSESDFLRMALVESARAIAMRWNVHRVSDDIEIEDVEPFRIRGAELPVEFDRQNHRLSDGRIPGDIEFEASQANRKARFAKK